MKASTYGNVPKAGGVVAVAAIIGVAFATTDVVADKPTNTAKNLQLLIQHDNYDQLVETLQQQGLHITHQLPIINSVGVSANTQQKAWLDTQHYTVQANYSVKVSNTSTEGKGGKTSLWGSRFTPQHANVPGLTKANHLHTQGITGKGIGIAFVDTGLRPLLGLRYDSQGQSRIEGTYDVFTDTFDYFSADEYGHGTHVASVAGNSSIDSRGRPFGVAPDSTLIGVKAFDATGMGTYADVIEGIQWVVDNKDVYNIRVMNLSFSGDVLSHYWEDPLNQAVMRAWNEGLVVVASSGNKGPEPMTVGVPGNVPYIITVGAMTDNFTPTDTSDDVVTSFSSSGPTHDGFVKPEIVAPGGHVLGLMHIQSYLAQTYPEFHDTGRYFEMSGTSQATAVVSGLAALLIEQNPQLSPDNIKCALLSSAKQAADDDGELAFSVFQQGAGMVDVAAASAVTDLSCGNRFMDLQAELNDEIHYFGIADIDDDGEFFLHEADSGEWYSGTVDGDGGLIWGNVDSSGGLIWGNVEASGGLIWNTSVSPDGGLIWNTAFNTDGGLIWNTGNISTATNICTNVWVDQH